MKSKKRPLVVGAISALLAVGSSAAAEKTGGTAKRNHSGEKGKSSRSHSLESGKNAHHVVTHKRKHRRHKRSKKLAGQSHEKQEASRRAALKP